MSKPELRDLDWDELVLVLEKLGQPHFRTKQIFQWVHQKGVTKWGEMTNIPQALRNSLAASCRLGSLPILRCQASKEDQTVKYLFELFDRETIETVLMGYDHEGSRERKTVCVSTQVGCRRSCAFCATGRSGFRRNLSVSEIVGQVLAINGELHKTNKTSVTNLVFMGMGEPLDNYQNLVKAIRIFNHRDGLNISWRRISVSTSGVVPGIYRLAQEGMPLVLAISLHGSNDQLRNQLMPINRKYDLEKLMQACRYWVERINRRITFEYVLLAGVNDNLEQARELASLLKGLLANVNLIPFNPIEGTDFGKPTSIRVRAFRRYLEEQGVTATVREEKGDNIAAACGQLRRQEMRANSDY